jgi:NADH/NAD ratio-sensing transcriptional regulator Rex
MSKPLTSTELIRLTKAKRKADVAVALLTVTRQRAQCVLDRTEREFADAEKEFRRASKECDDAWAVALKALKPGEVE